MAPDSNIRIIQSLTNSNMTTVTTLLTNTLNPSLQQAAFHELSITRRNQGFATELLVIADDSNVNISVRQAALVTLKNLIYDECSEKGTMPQEDLQVIKSNILLGLSRMWGNQKLTRTIREIIHLIAGRDYPDQWPDILPQVLNNIENSTEFNCISSSVQILKALTSVCGRSLEHQITLNNLCNNMFVPVFGLVNKLFANYSPDTQPILVSIFKIFNLAMFYHLPTIFMNNIHSVMIFCKKILQLPAQEMEPLKVICLKILNRLYSRHAASNVPYKLIKFSQDFHERYSNPMVEVFMLLLMNSNSSQEVLDLSLKCMTSIYKNYEPSAELIDRYRSKLVGLCIQRFKASGNFKSGQSVGSYITCLKEERSSLMDFLTALFNSNDSILGDLIENINQGDQKSQELAFYSFAALGQQVQECPQLHQNMSQFIVSYILPVLSGNSSVILKARGCQVISAYCYIQLPGDNLQDVFKFIYSCLTEVKEPYLNIYALEAFTHLIVRYEAFMKLIIPHLANILKVYTELMKQANGEVNEIIKSFEQLLANLDGSDLKPYIFDLVKFLIDLFHEYRKALPSYSQNGNSSDDEEDDNPTNACSGCIACIRQILSAENFPQQLYPALEKQCVLPLVISILQNKNLLHFQETLNILNMLLFRREGGELPEYFNQFFCIFTYGVLGIPQELGNMNLAEEYKSILVNVCVEPDEDIVSNIIGLLRNFVARLRGDLRVRKDELGISFMEYIFKIVQKVHTSMNEQKYTYKESDRWIILTLYISLIQYQTLNQAQFSHLLTNTLNWYQKASNQKARGVILIEVVLISLYFYPQATINQLNTQWFVYELLTNWDKFSYEYQMQRVIIGVAKMMEMKILNNQMQAEELIRRLPALAERFVSLNRKNKENEDPNNLPSEMIDVQEEAQEDLVAENTHLGMLPQQITPTANRSDHEKEEALNQCEEREWDEEYNKYYYSPLTDFGQLKYLSNVLGNCPYIELLPGPEQQRLSQIISRGQ